ncbi:nuclease domain-containing protein, partial [Salmonella enterica subsp. enterica serovar Enteritidis]|uniref:nuclease domain-containing protein n=1 Tax=Salmonella enterica TaxID=28901 RepID=UPI0039E8174D
RGRKCRSATAGVCVRADLRNAARGLMCTVRIPGHCNHNPDTSVLAHYRLAGTCGTATISWHELQAIAACISFGFVA